MSQLARWAFMVLPALLLVGLAGMSSQGRSTHPVELKVCRHRSSDGRRSHSIDLASIQKAYVGVARELQKGVRRLSVPSRPTQDQGFRTPLNSCRSEKLRRIRLTTSVPPALRGSTLVFVAIPREGSVPRVLRKKLPRGARIFIVRTPSNRAAGIAARAINAPVSYASLEFAQRFGVRCAPSVVRVSTDGATLEVQEAGP